MIYFSELNQLPIYGVKSEYLGRMVDLAIDPGQNPLEVCAYLVKSPGSIIRILPSSQLQSISVRAAQARIPRAELRPEQAPDGWLLIQKDILDQQIIDVNNQKVVRATDVEFEVEPETDHTRLRILGVNVGLDAALRRLLQGSMAKFLIRRMAAYFPARRIPWEFVNMIEPDPARRLRLKISYDRLARMHPSELAALLQELSHGEQKAVIESLDDVTAAKAMSRFPKHFQIVLLGGISSARAANIVEEMAPDEAADLLQEMPSQTSAELLSNMEVDEAREVQELLDFEPNSAGGLMTTDYLVMRESATIAEATEAVRIYDGPSETLHVCYLIDDEAILKGAVPLSRLLGQSGHLPLLQLCRSTSVSVPYYADRKKVVELFKNYKLLSLPVVDEQNKILGVITADDVIGQLAHK